MDGFTTDEEAATYRMLKQVLQNHVALQEMSILATSMACTGLLGECCATGTAPREVAAAMLGWLKGGCASGRRYRPCCHSGRHPPTIPRCTWGSIPGASMTRSGDSSTMPAKPSASTVLAADGLCSA